jgi:hypothetical protein
MDDMSNLMPRPFWFAGSPRAQTLNFRIRGNSGKGSTRQNPIILAALGLSGGDRCEEMGQKGGDQRAEIVVRRGALLNRIAALHRVVVYS